MLTIIVGGFFGDEGKGKITGYLGLRDKPDIAVRCGSVNAGHTIVFNNKKYRLRIVSTAFINRDTRIMIPAGALVNIDILFREIRETGVEDRIFIDRNAGVITIEHIMRERNDQYLSGKIGSTLQGVGAAMVDRVLRRLRLAHEYSVLNKMLCDTAFEINNVIDNGGDVLVEGVQGTFLSLYHGTYPYVTSRDTIASAFASEIGVGPKKIDEVIVVFKAYVTRVGNGPLPGELDREEVFSHGLIEYGSVTGRLRRVAPFNIELAKRAVLLNSATQAAITMIDKLFPETRNVREWGKLSSSARKWLEEIEDQLKIPVTLISTGEEVYSIIDLRREHGII